MKYLFSIVVLLIVALTVEAQCSARSGCNGNGRVGLFARRNVVVMSMPSSVLTKTTVTTTTTTTTSCASSTASGCSATSSCGASRVRIPRRATVVLVGCSASATTPQSAPMKK